MNTLLTAHGWQVAGWTMLHFLWVGALIALVGLCLRAVLGRKLVRMRYAVSALTLLAMAVAPVGVALWVAPQVPESMAQLANDEPSVVAKPVVSDSAEEFTNSATEIAGESRVNEGSGVELLTVAPVELDPEVLAGAIEVRSLNGKHLEGREVLSSDAGPDSHDAGRATANTAALDRVVSWLPCLWLIGAPLTFALLALGLVGSERLRRKSAPAGEAIEQVCQQMKQKLGVARRVSVAVCESLAEPVLVGIVRPLVLLPPAALTGWSAEELEMVLLHELAHVRRWDNLVNLGQRIIESVLFFHPCVWLVSRQVRIDREQCVDAVVVARTEQPQAYAELLVSLAAARSQFQGSHQPRTLAASAMARHPLAGRIRRILKLEDEPMLVTRGTMSWVGLAVVALASLLFWQPGTTSVANARAEEITTEDTESTEDEWVATKQETLTTKDEGDSDAAELAKVREELAALDREIEAAKIKSQEILRERQNMLKALGSNDNGVMVKYQRLLNEQGTRKSQAFKRKAELLTAHPRLMEEILAEQEAATQQGGGRLSLQERHRLDQEKALERERAAAQANSPFPTLAEQRAADMAYKLLGVELEKLTDEEMKRVTALKFAGGLRVTQSGFVEGHGYGHGIVGPLQEGDLLVGLHVWPTTSFADLQTLFERDDLDELNPLKFYVIRQMPKPPSDKDKKAKAEQSSGGDEYGGGEYGGGGVEFGGEYGGGGGAEYGGGGEYGGGEYVGGEYGAPKAKLVELVEMVDKLVTGRLEFDQAKWEAHQRKLVRDKAYSQPTAYEPLALSLSSDQRNVPESPQPPSRQAGEPFLYAGKSFKHWRNLWKYELSTGERINAINALAAFGRAGQAKEAAEAILDVAGEYDFASIEGGDTLKKDVLLVLTAAGSREVQKHWLPDLVERFEKEPARWGALLGQLLLLLESDDPQARKLALGIALDEQSRARPAAISFLARNTPVGDEEVAKLAAELLAHEKLETAAVGLELLAMPRRDKRGDLPSELRSLPAALLGLQHPEVKIRGFARARVKNLKWADAHKLAEALAEELSKQGQSTEQQVVLLRALAAVGKAIAPKSLEKPAPLLKQLDGFVKKEQPRELQIAAFVAMRAQLQSHKDAAGEIWQEVEKNLIEREMIAARENPAVVAEVPDEASAKRLRADLRAEEQALYPHMSSAVLN